jgi:hypothetical protein
VIVYCCMRVLRVLRYCGSVFPATASSLTRATADGGVLYNVVDVYNSATGAWSTAQLSVARYSPAAASVGNVALFAGGFTSSALLRRKGGEDGCIIVACVFCVLRLLWCCGSVCPATASSLMRANAGGSNVVDVYNSATGAWSTAQLSVGRIGLAAASVGSVALFAGGYTGIALLCREGVAGVVYCCVRVLRFARAAVLFSQQPFALSCAPLQVVLFLVLWIFTATAQQSTSAPSPLLPLPCSSARLIWWPRSCSRRHLQARWRSAALSR